MNKNIYRFLKENDYYWIVRKYPLMLNFFKFLFYEYNPSCLMKYLNNVFDYRKDKAENLFKMFDTNTQHPKNLVDYAFCWAYTKEGRDYWEIIHDKWRRENFYNKYYPNYNVSINSI